MNNQAPSPIYDSPRKHVNEHILGYTASNGHNAHTPLNHKDSHTWCLFTSLGRVTGNWRRTVLCYREYKGAYYVVASFGGSEKNPSWYLNIEKNNNAWIQIGTQRFWAKCEIVDPVEDKELRNYIWSEFVKLDKMYALYQKQCPDRLIPVVKIERI